MKTFPYYSPIIISLLLFGTLSLAGQNNSSSLETANRWYGGIQINSASLSERKNDNTENQAHSSGTYFSIGVDGNATFINDNNTYHSFSIGYGKYHNNNQATYVYEMQLPSGIDRRETEMERVDNRYKVQYDAGKQFHKDRFIFMAGGGIAYQYVDPVMYRNEFREFNGSDLVMTTIYQDGRIPAHELNLLLNGKVFFQLSNRFNIGTEVTFNAFMFSYENGTSRREYREVDANGNTITDEVNANVKETNTHLSIPFYDNYAISLQYRFR